jgi:C2H2-type zinc finger/Zinc finger, C2H2 type
LICAVCIEEVDRAYKTRRKIREAERYYFQLKRDELVEAKQKEEENKDSATINTDNEVKRDSFETIDDLIGELSSSSTETEMQQPSSSSANIKNSAKSLQKEEKKKKLNEASFAGNEIEPHANSDKAKVRNFSCTLCGSKFFSKVLLNLHIKRHSNNPNFKPRDRKPDDSTRPFQCTIEECSKYFKTIAELSSHQRRMHPGKPRTFKSKTSSKTPMRRYSCSSKIIETAKKRASRPKKQLPQDQDLKSLKCPICQKMFSTESNVSQHIKFVHGKVRRFTCDLCGLKMQHKSEMKKHLVRHINNSNFKTKQHGTDDETRLLKCDDCLKYFKSNFALKIHRSKLHQGNFVVFDSKSF